MFPVELHCWVAFHITICNFESALFIYYLLYSLQHSWESRRRLYNHFTAENSGLKHWVIYSISKRQSILDQCYKIFILMHVDFFLYCFILFHSYCKIIWLKNTAFYIFYSRSVLNQIKDRINAKIHLRWNHH